MVKICAGGMLHRRVAYSDSVIPFGRCCSGESGGGESSGGETDEEEVTVIVGGSQGQLEVSDEEPIGETNEDQEMNSSGLGNALGCTGYDTQRSSPLAILMMLLWALFGGLLNLKRRTI